MIIKDYLKKYGITKAMFARNIRVSRYSVIKYCQGHRPSAAIAAKIYKVTDQKVTFPDMGYGENKKIN